MLGIGEVNLGSDRLSHLRRPRESKHMESIKGVIEMANATQIGVEELTWENLTWILVKPTD